MYSKGFKNYNLKSYVGLGHSLNNQVIDDVIQFLKSILPFDSSLVILPKQPSEMSIKELKLAIRNLGLGSKAVGFFEKIEFVHLLNKYYEENNLNSKSK